VVIDNLNRNGVATTPHETDTPLTIDPDTMLSLSRTFQCLKSIGWWHSEVFKEPRIVQHSEFPACNNLDIARQFTRNVACPDFLGFLVPEMPDHGQTITQGDI
jgi:hypothetical protein